MYYVFAVSDGTAGTAARALRAALTQFESVNVEIVIRPTIRSADQINAVVSEASEKNGLLVHTLVSDEIRAIMINECRLQNVEQIDILGPLLARLSQQVSISPSEKPGLFSQLNEDYFRRIETMEFAFHHDDGLRVDEIKKAEIILLGVSRTFKTPLSIYLAFKGWFVANIPIIKEIDPPDVLNEIDPQKVFCLSTDTHHLARLRQARQNYLGGATGEYATVEYIKNELIYARRFYNRHPNWTIIEVTNKPIEEIASEILLLVKSRETS